MNDTPRQPTAPTTPRGGLLADPGRIAPHVDKGWRDDFLVELRLLGVPGTEIGDALVTVDSHVAESGESAQEAFGDPVPYARELARSRGDAAPSWSITRWTVLGNVAGLLGLLATTRALGAWLDGARIEVTVGETLGLALLLVLVAVVLRWSGRLVRLIVEHRVAVPLLAPVVLIGSFVALLLLFRQPLVEVGVAPVAVAGVLLLAVCVAAAWVDTPPDGDEITAPGQARTPSPWARLGTAAVLPILTLVMLGFTWLVHSLA